MVHLLRGKKKNMNHCRSTLVFLCFPMQIAIASIYCPIKGLQEITGFYSGLL